MRISDWSSDVCSSDLLDAGIAVSEGTPFIAQPAPGKVSGDRTILADGPKFVLERWPAGHRKVALPAALTGWLVPVTVEGVADGVVFRSAACVTVPGSAETVIAAGDAVMLPYPVVSAI